MVCWSPLEIHFWYVNKSIITYSVADHFWVVLSQLHEFSCLTIWLKSIYFLTCSSAFSKLVHVSSFTEIRVDPQHHQNFQFAIKIWIYHSLSIVNPLNHWYVEGNRVFLNDTSCRFNFIKTGTLNVIFKS